MRAAFPRAGVLSGKVAQRLGGSSQRAPVVASRGGKA
jgi:hypothetical protein